jgi:hypothetical protein
VVEGLVGAVAAIRVVAERRFNAWMSKDLVERRSAPILNDR